jgi:hypothetical protein
LVNSVGRTEHFGDKVSPAHRADDCVFIVMPDVKIRPRTQHSISLMALHNLLRERFAFYIPLYVTLIILELPDE